MVRMKKEANFETFDNWMSGSEIKMTLGQLSGIFVSLLILLAFSTIVFLLHDLTIGKNTKEKKKLDSDKGKRNVIVV